MWDAVSIPGGSTLIRIDVVTRARGVVMNAGICISDQDMGRLAREWLKRRLENTREEPCAPTG